MAKPPAIKHTAREEIERMYSGKPPEVLRDRPTLWFEDEEEYDRILLYLISQNDPVSQGEVILVKDLADCQWEIIRLRRMKRAAAAVEMPNAVWGLAGTSFKGNAPVLGVPGDYEGLAQIVRQAAKGDKNAREKLEIVMEDADVSYDMLLYKANSLSLNTMTAIEMAIHRKERERHTLHRMLDERKKANMAMGKVYLDALFQFGKESSGQQSNEQSEENNGWG